MDLDSIVSIIKYENGMKRRRVHHTGHELDDVHLSFTEDDLNMLRHTLFKLSLKVPTSMLVLTHSIDFARVILKRNIAKAVQWVLRISITTVLSCSTRALCESTVVVWLRWLWRHSKCSEHRMTLDAGIVSVELQWRWGICLHAISINWCCIGAWCRGSRPVYDRWSNGGWGCQDQGVGHGIGLESRLESRNARTRLLTVGRRLRGGWSGVCGATTRMHPTMSLVVVLGNFGPSSGGRIALKSIVSSRKIIC